MSSVGAKKAQLKVVRNWLEVYCPETGSFLFKIDYTRGLIYCQRRNQNIYLDLKDVEFSPPIDPVKNCKATLDKGR